MACAHRLPSRLCFCKYQADTKRCLQESVTNFSQVVIFLVFGLPESPRWLYAHGRHDETLQVLCDVWDGGPDHPKVSAQQKDILEVIELEHKQGEYKWKQILKRDEVQTGRRVMLAYGMQSMNQMGGINLVV